MSVARKTISGAIWLTGTQIGIMFFSFGANIVLARLLMPEDFGIYALALSLNELFFILSGWSFGLAVIQAKESSEDFVDTGYFLSIVVGAGVVVLILISSLFIRKLYSTRVLSLLWIFSVLQVIVMLGDYRSALLERNMEYGKFSIVRFSSRVIPWSGAVILAWLGAGIWSFVGLHVLTALILFFGFRAVSEHRFRWRITRDAKRRLFRFGGKMFIARGLETGFYRISHLMIGTLVGTAALGYFNQAFTLSEMGHRFSWPALGQVPFAAYSRLQDDKVKLSKGYELVNYFLLRFLTPLALIFFLTGDQVIVLLYGEKWRSAGPLLQIFAIYALTMPIFENMKALLYSQDRIPGAIFSRLCQVSFLFPAMYFALKKFGIEGAVYALDIGILIGIVIIYFWVKDLVRLKIRYVVFPPIFAALGTYVIWNILVTLLYKYQSSFKNLIIDIAFISGLYFVQLFIIEKRALLEHLRYLIKNLRSDPGLSMFD